MTSPKLDLAGEEREDALRDDIDALSAKFRAEGQIGDLVRLRNARVHGGRAQAGFAALPILSQGKNRTPANAEDVALSADMATLDLKQVQTALDAYGCLILRTVFAARRTLEFRKLYKAARAAAQELSDLEADRLPDLRHTDSVEMFSRFDRGGALYPGASDAEVFSFMSPRIAFELCDFLRVFV